MAIFNQIGKKISQTTQNAVKGTKDLADIARLNSQIAEEQKLLNSFYMQIGKKYYELSPESTDDNFAAFCVSITECMTKLTSLREEIQNIKGIKKCAGCGAEIPVSTIFCGSCGYDTRKEPEATVEDSIPRCPNCNKELTDNIAFCTDCGQKL